VAGDIDPALSQRRLTTGMEHKGQDGLGHKIAGTLSSLAPQIGTMIMTGGLTGGSRAAIALLAGAQGAGSQYADTYGDLMKQPGMTHEKAWAQVAPWAVGSGIVTGALTALGGKSGVEALARNPQALRQTLGSAWKSFFKGAVKENLEEMPDELLSQISAELAVNPKADITQTIGNFIRNAPELMISVALLGGGGDAKQTFSENRHMQMQRPAETAPVMGPPEITAAPNKPQEMAAQPATVAAPPQEADKASPDAGQPAVAAAVAGPGQMPSATAAEAAPPRSAPELLDVYVKRVGNPNHPTARKIQTGQRALEVMPPEQRAVFEKALELDAARHAAGIPSALEYHRLLGSGSIDPNVAAAHRWLDSFRPEDARTQWNRLMGASGRGVEMAAVLQSPLGLGRQSAPNAAIEGTEMPVYASGWRRASNEAERRRQRVRERMEFMRTGRRAAAAHAPAASAGANAASANAAPITVATAPSNASPGLRSSGIASNAPATATGYTGPTSTGPSPTRFPTAMQVAGTRSLAELPSLFGRLEGRRAWALEKVRELVAISNDPNRPPKDRESARRGARRITMDLAESAGLTLTLEEVEGATNPLLARIDGWGRDKEPSAALLPRPSSSANWGVIKGSSVDQWADQVLARSRGNLNSGLDPVVLGAFAVKGAALIESGIRTFAEWGSQMIEKFGEQIRPHLEVLWEESRRTVQGGAGMGISDSRTTEVPALQDAPQLSTAGDRHLTGTTEESVDYKLYHYCLNPNHPVGGPKSVWFRDALGFTRANAEVLARQLTFNAAKAVESERTAHGIKSQRGASASVAVGAEKLVPLRPVWRTPSSARRPARDATRPLRDRLPHLVPVQSPNGDFSRLRWTRPAGFMRLARRLVPAPRRRRGRSLPVAARPGFRGLRRDAAPAGGARRRARRRWWF
jgi:hypothetical protein